MLVVGRELPVDVLSAIAKAMPPQGKSIRIEPLFLHRRQIEKSLDVFPMEWLDIQERHLTVEGENTFKDLKVPRRHLRLQCEHELRGKNIQLRQTYIVSQSDPKALEKQMADVASSFSALFRSLLRLQGESPPATNAQVVERVAEVYDLDPRGLLGAHLVRYARGSYNGDELLVMYKAFMAQVDRLTHAIDELPVA